MVMAGVIPGSKDETASLIEVTLTARKRARAEAKALRVRSASAEMPAMDVERKLSYPAPTRVKHRPNRCIRPASGASSGVNTVDFCFASNVERPSNVSKLPNNRIMSTATGSKRLASRIQLDVCQPAMSDTVNAVGDGDCAVPPCKWRRCLEPLAKPEPPAAADRRQPGASVLLKVPANSPWKRRSRSAALAAARRVPLRVAAQQPVEQDDDDDDDDDMPLGQLAAGRPAAQLFGGLAPSVRHADSTTPSGGLHERAACAAAADGVAIKDDGSDDSVDDEEDDMPLAHFLAQRRSPAWTAVTSAAAAASGLAAGVVVPRASPLTVGVSGAGDDASDDDDDLPLAYSIAKARASALKVRSEAAQPDSTGSCLFSQPSIIEDPAVASAFHALEGATSGAAAPADVVPRMATPSRGALTVSRCVPHSAPRLALQRAGADARRWPLASLSRTSPGEVKRRTPLPPPPPPLPASSCAGGISRLVLPPPSPFLTSRAYQAVGGSIPSPSAPLGVSPLSRVPDVVVSPLAAPLRMSSLLSPHPAVGMFALHTTEDAATASCAASASDRPHSAPSAGLQQGQPPPSPFKVDRAGELTSLTGSADGMLVSTGTEAAVADGLGLAAATVAVPLLSEALLHDAETLTGALHATIIDSKLGGGESMPQASQASPGKRPNVAFFSNTHATSDGMRAADPVLEMQVDPVIRHAFDECSLNAWPTAAACRTAGGTLAAACQPTAGGMLEAAAVEIVDPRDCDLVDEFSLDAWPAGLCPSRESEPSFSGQIAAAPAPSQLMPLIPCAATSMLPGGCSTSDTRNAALPCGPRQLGSGGGIEGGGPAAFGFASSFVLSRSPQRFLTGSSMRTGTAASGEGGCSAAVVHPPPPPMQMCMDGIKPAGPSPRAAISAGRQADWQPAALEVLSSNNPEDRRIQQPRPVDTDAAVSSASVEQLTMPSHAATLDTALRLCETRDVKDADTLDASSVRAAAPHSSAHRSRGAVAPEEALAVAPSASHEPPTSRPATPVHPVAASPDPLQARALLRQQYCYTTTPSHSPATAPPARGMTQQTPSPITPLLQKNQNSAVGSHGSLLPRPSNGTPWTSRPPRPTSRPQERSSEALMPPSAQHGSHWWNGSKPTTNSHQSSPLVAPTARTADATTTSSPDHQETQAAGPCGIFGGTAGPALPTNSHDGGTEAPNAVDIIQQYEVPADCSERAVGTNSAAAPPTPQGCCIASNATALTSRMAPAAPGGAAPAAGIHGLSVCSSTRDVLLVDAGGATAAAAADRTSPHVVSARGVVSPRCLAAAAAAAATDRQVSARGVAPPHCPSSAADTSARSGPAAAAGGVRVIGSAANYLGSAAAHLSAGSGTAAAGVRPGARLSWVAQLVGDQADRPSPPVQDYSPSGSHRPLHNSLNQSVNHSPSGSYRPLHHSSIPGGLGGPHAGGEEDLMDVLRYTRPVVKRGGSSLGGQQPHGFQPVHSPLLHHPGQGASGTGASSSSSMRHFRDRPPTKLFSPYGGVRPGQSPVGQQQLTLPPSVTVPLEVEFREAFFNQHLCEAWHEGQRWARMDVCGMEVADTPKAAHHLRLQVARQKLSMNRGQGAVEVLTRRVTAEWQHLRAVREAAALRSVPVTATASTRTAGRGGGTPPCCGTSPSHSHQATTVLACTRGAVGAAAGGGSDTPPPCCGMPHPHSHHITTAAGGGAAAGGGTPPSCCDALQPHSHHTIIAPAGTAAAISIAGGGGGTPPSCCDTLQPHSHQTTVTPVSTTAVIRAAAGGGTPPCMTPCAGEQSVMENMGCDGGRQCQAAIANLDCDTVEQHQAAAFANMACDSAEGHQAAAGSSAGVVLSCVNEAHTDLADAACLVELRTTAGTAQGGSDDKPATKDDTLSHDAGVTLESNVHVDECATDAAARESGSGCSSSGVAAHRRSPADWYRAARMLKGWAMGALAGGISGATAAAAAGDRQDNDKVMPTSTVDGAFAGTPSPSSTAGPTPPAVSATPFPSAAVAAAVTRMGGWTGTPSAGVPATAQGVAETATPSAGPFGTTPPVSAGGLLLPPRPWRELSVLGSPSILKAGRHCRLGLVASPVPKCVVFATELELGPMAGYHP